MSREMKESGVEWIGQIPDNWDKMKLKEKYMFEKGVNAALYTQEYIGKNKGIYPVFSGQTSNNGVMGSINTFDYDLEECLFTTTVGAKVMTPMILRGKFSLSQNCLIMKRTKNCDNRFIYYTLFPLFHFEKSLIPSYMQPSLRIGDLREYQIYTPSLIRQKEIVDILDIKVYELDSLIAKTKSTIADYKLLKQSIITEAVIKGLDKTVEMKDSGIEWVGEIPKCWDILRGKVVLSKLSRPILESDTVITCFRDGEVTLRSNRREDGFTMADKEIGYQGVEPGDLVVHGMDGFAGAIGISDSRGKSTPVLNVLDSNQNKEYIMFYLRSMAISDVFLALATGIRVRSCDLRWNKIGDLPYPIPPIEEQREIVEHIKNKLQQICVLVEKKQNLLEELESYKKSLIYEYVTGKKEII